VRRALVFAATLCVAAVGATAEAADGGGKLDGFWSPTRNIHCFGYSGGAGDLRCEIYKHDWRSPRGACGPKRTAIFTMTARGRPRAFCPNDSVPQGRTLAYGKAWKLGSFTCTMRISGVTCRNARGYGWFLSRQRYTLYR
jgi:hypothetical protein